MNEKEKHKLDLVINFMRQEHLNRPLWNSVLFGVKLELRALVKDGVLDPNERIQALAPCLYRGRRSLIVITDLRVMVINKGLFGIFSQASMETDYFSKTAGTTSSGRLFKTLVIETTGDGNNIVVQRLWGNHDLNVIDNAYTKAQAQYERMQHSPSPSASPYQNSVDNLEASLIKLKNLREAGDITQAEYQQLRQELITKAGQGS